MAEFFSEQYQKAFEDDPRDVNKVNEWGGRVRVAYFKHTTDGTEAANDTVKLVKLPLNARVLTGQLHVDGIDATSDGATTPTTITVGDAGDADRYLASTTADSDANTELNDPSEAGFCFEVDTEANRDVFLTFTAVDAETGKVIEGYMLYAVD